MIRFAKIAKSENTNKEVKSELNSSFSFHHMPYRCLNSHPHVLPTNQKMPTLGTSVSLSSTHQFSSSIYIYTTHEHMDHFSLEIHSLLSISSCCSRHFPSFPIFILLPNIKKKIEKQSPHL